MDFEFDFRSLGMAALFYLVIMLGVWKWQIGDGWPMFSRIVISLVAAPMCYFIVMWQLNR